MNATCKELLYDYIPTTDMVADALKKGLARPAESCRDGMGLGASQRVSISPAQHDAARATLWQ
jgi:hypothetical protein